MVAARIVLWIVLLLVVRGAGCCGCPRLILEFIKRLPISALAADAIIFYQASQEKEKGMIFGYT